jgi:hypothetical protein
LRLSETASVPGLRAIKFLTALPTSKPPPLLWLVVPPAESPYPNLDKLSMVIERCREMISFRTLKTTLNGAELYRSTSIGNGSLCNVGLEARRSDEYTSWISHRPKADEVRENSRHQPQAPILCMERGGAELILGES